MTDYNAVFLYAMMANAIVSFFIPVERGRQFVVVILGVAASNIAWLILFDKGVNVGIMSALFKIIVMEYILTFVLGILFIFKGKAT